VAYLKPLPEITELNRPFWDALKRHQFTVPRCADCGAYNWVPYPACRTCLSERQAWTPVSGDATVYSYSVCYRGPGAFGLEVPYAVVLGQLAEHPRSMLVLGNLVNRPVDQISIGMPIQIGFLDVPDEDVTLWQWQASAAG